MSKYTTVQVQILNRGQNLIGHTCSFFFFGKKTKNKKNQKKKTQHITFEPKGLQKGVETNYFSLGLRWSRIKSLKWG